MANCHLSRTEILLAQLWGLQSIIIWPKRSRAYEKVLSMIYPGRMLRIIPYLSLIVKLAKSWLWYDERTIIPMNDKSTRFWRSGNPDLQSSPSIISLLINSFDWSQPIRY
ncbi:MAG: hypothetical protein ACD_2C00032G0001 [uncultured bacterium (gcode 4)]|uniref:Uncharacterized protein n=1 Tax=uncultured bacterium (gcode 4) TaxID=1234023 RepID=K2FGD0_9BACT|nr:MAG: hypothetical protein ACD_2C00032G0001 [uncultured bacterium (gcode 4)]